MILRQKSPVFSIDVRIRLSLTHAPKKSWKLTALKLLLALLPVVAQYFHHRHAGFVLHGV